MRRRGACGLHAPPGSATLGAGPVPIGTTTVPKIFVASPRDVQLERMRVSWAVRRLNGEFDRTVQFDIVRWEEGYYTADRTFQVQIDAALAECEIVVAILGMRIGTPVEDDFPRMPDGEPYPSGTAYEILASIASARRHGRPDVYVFFKDAATAFRVTRPDEIASAQEQWARLVAFRERWFEAPDGRSIGAYQTFDTPDAFEAKVEDLLRKWIRARYGDRPNLRWSIALRGSPFPGLEPFDARHADVFCGRNRKVARALEILMQAAEGAPPASRRGRSC